MKTTATVDRYPSCKDGCRIKIKRALMAIEKRTINLMEFFVNIDFAKKVKSKQIITNERLVQLVQHFNKWADK